jgi:hypothetical protein
MIGKMRQVFQDWLNKEKKLEIWMSGIILVGAISLIFVTILTGFGFHVGDFDSNRQYLLSSFVQGLATILALLVTVSVIATQLAAGTYTPRVIKHHISNIWLWLAIIIYLIAIIWAKIVLSYPDNWDWFTQNTQDSMDTALILAITALLYIIPFTLATLKSLQPESIAKRLVNNNDTDSLNDFLRKSINDGTITLTKDILRLYFFKVTKLLLISADRDRMSKQTAGLLISVGRHACQVSNTEAVETVINLLTALVEYCNKPPRLLRQAADNFNEAVIEVYNYSSSLAEESK